MAAPAKYDITGVAGDTWSQTFTLKQRIPDPDHPGQYIDGNPLNLTGATIAAQIRKAAGDTGAPLAVIAIVGTPGTDGKITLLLTPAQTQTLNNGVWDLQITWPAVGAAAPVVQTVLAGAVSFSMDVTRGS